MKTSAARLSVLVLLGIVTAGGCGLGQSPLAGTGAPPYESWKASLVRDPGAPGTFIVDVDIAIPGEKRLREYYGDFVAAGADQALIVHSPGGLDAVWSTVQKKDLRYCVSDTFGSRKAAVLAAMESATGSWEAAADVDFVHVPAEDASCDGANPNVVFDVRPVSGGAYLARAFFPNYGRADRNVLIDDSSFSVSPPLTLAGILRHELGHALGFRHEHTRPESGTCYEDANWRPLTPYDSASVMHYPQCNGTGDWSLTLTQYDRDGAVALYAAPGETPPPPEPGPNEERTETFAGSVAAAEEIHFGPFVVVPGTIFQARMSGTGDPDLYLRFGEVPTTAVYHCRSASAGASESCSLTVPAGIAAAYVMVRGYSAATYDLTVTYRTPVAPAPAGDTLVQNGSFEANREGEPPAPWTMKSPGTFVSTDQEIAARDGIAAGRFSSLTSSSFREVLSNCFSLPAGAGLRVTGFGLTPQPVENTRVSFKVYYFSDGSCTTPASDAYQTQISASLGTSNEWNGLSYERDAAQIPPDATHAVIGVRAKYIIGTGTSKDLVYFDAVEVTAVRTLENGSFEADEAAPPAGWTLLSPGRFASHGDRVTAADGARAASFDSLTTSIGGREIRSSCASLDPTQPLQVSAWMRTDRPVENTRAGFKLYFFTDPDCTVPASTAYYTPNSAALTAPGVWELRELTRGPQNLPPDARFVAISLRAKYVSGVGSSSDVVYFDGVRVGSAQ